MLELCGTAKKEADGGRQQGQGQVRNIHISMAPGMFQGQFSEN